MQDMGQEFRLVLRIEQSLPNPVKAIAKDTLGGSVMLFHPNGGDLMPPSPDMISPAFTTVQFFSAKW
jgi:hypothetical protein